jgi:pilus assembly protein Flp/PilA
MPRLSACYSIIVGRTQALAKDRKGATAVEYAMIAAGIAGAIIATVIALGTKVSLMFDGISAAM